MPVTFLTSITAGPGATGGATGTVDTTGATLVVISASWWDGEGATTANFSDSKGNTWTLAAQQASTMRHQFAYALSPTVGTGHTFTVTTSGGTNNGYPAIIVLAFSGTGSYQTRSGASAFTGSPLATGSVTPTQDGALLLTGLSINNASLPASLAVTSFTLTTKAGVGGVCFPGAAGYYVQPTAAAINPTWTWSGVTTQASASTVVFLPAAAAARSQTFILL